MNFKQLEKLLVSFCHYKLYKAAKQTNIATMYELLLSAS